MIEIKNPGILNELTVGNSAKLEYTTNDEVKTVLFFETPTQSDYVKVEMDGTVKLLKETTEKLVVNYAGLNEKDEKITEGKVEFTMKQPEPKVKEEPAPKVEKPKEPAPKPEQPKAEPKKEEPAAPKKAAPKRSRKAPAKKAEEPKKVEETTTTEGTPVAQPFEGTAQNVNKHYLYRRSPGSKLK